MSLRPAVLEVELHSPPDLCPVVLEGELLEDSQRLVPTLKGRVPCCELANRGPTAMGELLTTNSTLTQTSFLWFFETKLIEKNSWLVLKSTEQTHKIS